MAKKKSATPEAGGIKGFLGKAFKSFYSGGSVAKDWSYWLAQKGGRIGFVIASTSIVVLMPLIFEIAREGQMLEVERSQVKDYKSQGFSERQLREMGFQEASIRPPNVAMK
mmetsp:Transcript_19675/g.28942  ORF Transcript_19675/g.28942 Transcript_19675/m.28942 type:complete len:111 (+) Transcript_19675:209-541(+)|eukprot:CAMPEP_0195514080 /NCGR_PEP_ID=MMETSP0794_2-20130614/5581_1 /TAXON_ID=515487 /ORGANISM="Stephanopyxis turris, Strain CCMP 815" /LENGTH=110 /DNA_ID=CAMNT_0040642245 /DNA_START=191 /DNA_END=523 /DNA_ORIENTATION=-